MAKPCNLKGLALVYLAMVATGAFYGLAIAPHVQTALVYLESEFVK